MTSPRYAARPALWSGHDRRDAFPDPAATDAAEAERAASAAEALAGGWHDGGPLADRLAFLDLCNPDALGGAVATAPRRARRIKGALASAALTRLAACRALLALHGREPQGESPVAGGHQDR